jgi:DNA-binding GntR family transcriptional regulator
VPNPVSDLPKTRTATVVDRLREEIREGVLAPGTRLRQAHVAKAYGVSTTPIREAFAALEREGLLQSSAHRGVVVFAPSAEDVREIYEVRIPLETHATLLGVPNLDERTLKRMAKLMEQIVKVEKKGDFATSAELNNEFHGSIYASSGAKRLESLISDLRESSRAYMRFFGTINPRLEDTESEHQEIYDACVARAPKKAAKATEKHLLHTVRVVAKALEERTA